MRGEVVPAMVEIDHVVVTSYGPEAGAVGLVDPCHRIFIPHSLEGGVRRTRHPGVM